MDKTHYADYDTLARIAELEAENARMKESCDFAWRNARTIDAVRMEAEKKLLAAQLRINELREALEDVALNPSESAYWLFSVEQILATPDATPELDALVRDAELWRRRVEMEAP